MRMEKLLANLGVLTAAELSSRHRAGGGHSAPWMLAARVLASNGSLTLAWPELWNVLRWYLFAGLGNAARLPSGLGLDSPADRRWRRSGPRAPWQSAAGNGAQSSGDTQQARPSWHAPFHSKIGGRKSPDRNLAGKPRAFGDATKPAVLPVCRKPDSSHGARLRQSMLRALCDPSRVALTYFKTLRFSRKGSSVSPKK